MIRISSISVRKSLSRTEDVQIQRHRHILIVILVVCLAFSVVTLVNAIFGSEIKIGTIRISQGIQTSQALTSIILDAFGLFVTHGYHKTGLHVFAWLNILLLILVSIGLVVFILFYMVGSSVLVSLIDESATSSLTDDSSWDVSNILIIYFTLIFLTAFILFVFIIRLCFKLAHLLAGNRGIEEI